MDFISIQNAVIADAFGESKRADVKQWINFRLGWMWDVDEWTFKMGTDLVTVTTGSQAVTSVPTDFATALAIYKSDGAPLEAVTEPREFYRRYYNATSTSTGEPEAFTVIGSSIFVGPTSSVTKTDYQLVYEKAPTLLSANSDVPAIPAQYHMALVHGGKAEGLKLMNIPLWESFDQDFQAAITAMRRQYLVGIRGASEQFGAYRADTISQWS